MKQSPTDNTLNHEYNNPNLHYQFQIHILILSSMHALNTQYQELIIYCKKL